ncbi:15514_t:CDS:2 [Cetraspora pellucida]|uniref:15514_t:CDS:1 n=1 Tax=Cetraspora pellucida TaxID=1433469 RepID=A0A9N8VZ92_9GLOM|nr:15514_t:CDS:2 [Cetraspora pellucida]
MKEVERSIRIMQEPQEKLKDSPQSKKREISKTTREAEKFTTIEKKRNQ